MNELLAEMTKALDENRTTVNALAAATKLSRMQIYRIRTGENKPTFEAAEAIARAIGLEIVFQPAS